MDRIRGDIDLTQNLDFYRKKPEMLLPKNVDLSKDQSPSKINIDNSGDTYLTINYNDDMSYTNITNLDFSSYYNPDTITYNYSNNGLYTLTSTNSITFNYHYDRNNHSFRFNTFNRDMINTMNISFATKLSKYKEKAVKIWDHIIKAEPKSIKATCSKCGKIILNPTSYKHSQLCKSCGYKKDIRFGRFTFQGFKFYHKDRSDDYEYYDEIPWENSYDYETSYWSPFNRKRNRVQIPWLQELSSRIYQDYIDDLHEEKDYSSYLTNMGWLGIHE